MKMATMPAGTEESSISSSLARCNGVANPLKKNEIEDSIKCPLFIALSAVKNFLQWISARLAKLCQ